MTPKEKANELYKKMFNSMQFLSDISAKQCSLVAVTEILENYPEKNIEITESFDLGLVPNKEFIFWTKVKEEIENL